MFLSLLLSTIPSTSAFCGTYVGQAGATLYNHVSQVAIVRQERRTTLNLAMDYEGDLTQFALVVPVPVVLGPDDVKLVDPELFRTLDTYSGPRLVSYSCSNFYGDTGWYGDDGSGGGGGCLGCADYDLSYAKDYGAVYDDTGGDYAPPAVTVESSFSEGDYDIVVLSAEQSGDLYQWLGENGYELPEGGEAILDEYIAAGSYFFAAKVSLDATEDGAPVGLAPIQFSYDADVFSLPVRIGTISSDGEQDVIIYTITTTEGGKVAISNYPEVPLEQECMWAGGEEFGDFYNDQIAEAQATEARPGWVTEYSWSSGSCDPCSGNPPDDTQLAELGFEGEQWDMHFTRLHLRYGANDVDQDLSLYLSRESTNEQVRYITYLPELEDQFPICGEGWAADPGTCADADKSYEPPPKRGSGAALPFAASLLLTAALLRRRRV